MADGKKSRRSRRCHTTRLRSKAHLTIERLEDRTLPSANGSTAQWLVRIEQLPGYTRVQQIQGATDLLHAAHVNDQDVKVVDSVGVPDIIVVNTPASVQQGTLDRELAVVPGFVYTEPYDPDADPGTLRSQFPSPPGDDSAVPSDPVPDNTPAGFAGPSFGPNVLMGVNGFDGIIAGQAGNFRPPDSDGAVGPSSFIESINTAIDIYQKDGTPVTPITSFGTFFSPLPATLNFSDPVTLYNDITQRFFVCVLDYDTTANMRLDVAISKSNNPTSLTTSDWSFTRYNVNDGSGGFDFADYPKAGYNADGYVVSFNMFPNLGFFDHVSTIAIQNNGVSPGASRSFRAECPISRSR